jgi:hypothetical protein
VGASLDPGGDDAGGPGVTASQQSRGQRRACGRPHGRDVGAIHEGKRPSVGRVEAADHGLVGGPVQVEREQTHELGGEHTTGGQERGHTEQGPVTVGHHDAAAGRHQGPTRAQVGHGIGECVDQAVEVEHRSDVVT